MTGDVALQDPRIIAKDSWKESFFGRFVVEVFSDRLALVGATIVIALVAMATFAPALVPYDPLEVEISQRFIPPSRGHLLGTDEFGRDILSRTIAASRVSVLGSLTAVCLATLIGIPWGLIPGFFGGLVDAVLMRVIDFLLAIPSILLALVIVGTLGPGSVNAMIAIAITNVPRFARLARSSAMVEKEELYVLASRSLGADSGRLLFRVIFPNCIPPILVQITVSLAYAVLLESALSFLGLGTQPPNPSWGYMLSRGRSFLREAPWCGVFPGAVITLFVLGITFLSDALRVAFGGRSRR